MKSRKVFIDMLKQRIEVAVVSGCGGGGGKCGNKTLAMTNN